MRVDVEQGTERWLNERLGRITASVAAACLGLDKYKSPRAAWKDITGRSRTISNKNTRRGTAFEQNARNAYAALLHVSVDPVGFWVHDEFKWLGASPDGLIRDGKGILELKVPNKLPESIPLVHRIQMLIGLACTGRQYADYFAYNAFTKAHYWNRIERCQGIDGLIRKLEAWYREFVIRDEQPPRRDGKRDPVPKGLQLTKAEKAAKKTAGLWGFR